MPSELRKLNVLVARNIKLYFKDKMVFFMSLITPVILIVLYLTFLRGIYVDSLVSSLPEGILLSDEVIDAFTGGWLFSSIMAVSSVTVAFCSNMMVTDKINKTRLDFQIAPIKAQTLQVSYILSNFITTMLVMLCVLVISCVYFAIAGWFLSFVDLLLILLVTVISVMFGALLAGAVGMFVNSTGALSAVATLVSSMYGFICGAYMPISMFGTGMRYFVAFLPGTYGTVLFRNYFMRGVLEEIGKFVPGEVVEGIGKAFDCKLDFFGTELSPLALFAVLVASVAVLFAVYVLISVLKHKRKHKIARPENVSEPSEGSEGK